ncbi:MAG: CRISPR-associated helicase Cas3' [Chlorobi bacterium CHB2]|nr:CRISPR-associated helicase Cas3' [Chlorobi bacterium CHB2]
MNILEPWRIFWAKTDRSGQHPEWVRPLWAHLIDVANAAEMLWNKYIPNSFRAQLSDALYMDEQQVGHTLSLLIGLHDLGKAIPAFQGMHQVSKNKFPDEFYFHDPPRRVHHGYATIAIMLQWSESPYAPPEIGDSMEAIAAFVGFHHGRICSRSEWYDLLEQTDGPLGNASWREAQQQLIHAVISAWNPQWPKKFFGSTWPSWLLGFAGWTTLADWIGSMGEHYGDVDVCDCLMDYTQTSIGYARSAMQSAGLHLHSALNDPGFGELFQDSNGKPLSPRPLQNCLANLELPKTKSPMLTIVEAPTGEGKTEASFYLAARQQSQQRGSGIYVAMPTQATSNGLLNRFKSFLSLSHGQDAGAVNMRLVHGNDHLHPDHQAMVSNYFNYYTNQQHLTSIFEDETISTNVNSTGELGRVLTATWFLPKKRALLAPYGIGTVDQVFLGVLFAKHFFLRLFGLAGKTVIFDEVHAYDMYMSRLFERLLVWLRELGTHVIILSATLPISMRLRFLKAWGVDDPVEENSIYPGILSVVDGKLIRDTFKTDQYQAARIRWLSPNPEIIIDAIVHAYEEGATVGVIVNTVDRAQAIFNLVRNRLGSERTYLFHARFPYGLRIEIEAQVRDHFGKSRLNCVGAVLIATQVAEQSLDLDFDVLFSDLAPIDLLLQRAGRLHRHQRPRPVKYVDPIIYILCSEAQKNELPAIDKIGGGSVYNTLVMWKTWGLLHKYIRWELPQHYRQLIEGVYGISDDTPHNLSRRASEEWEKAREKSENESQKAKVAAETRLIRKPNELRKIVNISELILEEDDENIHRDLRALTRLGEQSVNVICLHQVKDGSYFMDIECTITAPLTLPLSHDQVKVLLYNSVRIGRKDIVTYLLSQRIPFWSSLTEEVSALRGYKLLIFNNGEWYGEKTPIVRFDIDLGIVIHN